MTQSNERTIASIADGDDPIPDAPNPTRRWTLEADPDDYVRIGYGWPVFGGVGTFEALAGVWYTVEEIFGIGPTAALQIKIRPFGSFVTQFLPYLIAGGSIESDLDTIETVVHAGFGYKIPRMILTYQFESGLRYRVGSSGALVYTSIGVRI